MKLTFYGGIKEIGGNKILLEADSTRIFLDFGKNYGRFSEFFEEYLQPRTIHGLKDYLELELLPLRNNIYRNDLIKILIKEKYSKLKEYLKTDIDGILISHAHLDHTGFLSFVNETIPVFVSNTSMLAIKAFQTIRPHNLESEILFVNKRIKNTSKKNISSHQSAGRVNRNFQTVNDLIPFKIKNIEITPIPTSHSIPGALMYFIKTRKHNILYTGDFRIDKSSKKDYYNILKPFKDQGIDILITEGTRINDEKPVSENEVYEKSLEILKKVKQLILIDYTFSDVTRFNTLCKIAKKLKRTLVIPTKNYYYLRYLNEGLKLSNPLSGVKIYNREKCIVPLWEKDLLENYDTVTVSQLNRSQSKYILVLNYFQINELIDIKPKEGSYFLHAITEPHSEESELSEERFLNWIDFFKLSRPERSHASGHISKNELADFIKFMDPKLVIPIHTQNPEKFKDFCSKVYIPKLNETKTF